MESTPLVRLKNPESMWKRYVVLHVAAVPRFLFVQLGRIQAIHHTPTKSDNN